MSFPIVICVVASEFLVLLLLWIALRVNMPRVARPFIACLALSGAWGAWVLVLVLRGPPAMIALTISGFALSSVGTAVALHIATRSEGERHGEDPGGGFRSRPEAPRDGGGGEPAWWPEFERQVGAYAAEREHQRERDPVTC